MGGLSVLCVAFLVGLEATAAGGPTAREVLGNFSKALDNYDSFIMKVRVSTDHTIIRTLASGIQKQEKKKFSTFETRFEKGRGFGSSRSWGNVTSTPGEWRKEKEAQYSSKLWDGKNWYIYFRAGVQGRTYEHGTLNIQRKNHVDPKVVLRVIDLQSGVTPFMPLYGYFPGNGYERIDFILRRPRRISLRKDTHTIPGSTCYVLDASTKRGRYTFWIDPEHGYNLAKAIMRRRRGDLKGNVAEDRVLNKEQRNDLVWDNITFKKIGEVWVPATFDMRGEWIYSRKLTSKVRRHVEMTDIVFDPDHDALRSFFPDDIEDGAEVHVSSKNHAKVYAPGEVYKYIWQDGKLMPKNKK